MEHVTPSSSSLCPSSLSAVTPGGVLQWALQIEGLQALQALGGGGAFPWRLGTQGSYTPLPSLSSTWSPLRETEVVFVVVVVICMGRNHLCEVLVKPDLRLCIG